MALAPNWLKPMLWPQPLPAKVMEPFTIVAELLHAFPALWPPCPWP